ncbi:MAG: hypothetical protein VX154_04325 [Pseudomonadota bacterium]|nr:hypothetical protein [Pseudomonadota bacterium]
MFKFDNYIDGAKPWVVASWLSIAGFFVSAVYLLIVLVSADFPTEAAFNNTFPALVLCYTAVIVSLALNMALKGSGAYMEMGNNSDTTYKYGTRVSVSLISPMLPLSLIMGNPAQWVGSEILINYICLLGLLVYIILYFGFTQRLKKQFKKGWEQRRLQAEKDDLADILEELRSYDPQILGENLAKLAVFEASLAKITCYEDVMRKKMDLNALLVTVETIANSDEQIEQGVKNLLA